MTAKIIELIPQTPAALIKAKIQRETAILGNTRGLNAPMSARETLINYAEVLEQNAVYLEERNDPELEPVIVSNIDMAAKIRYWLIQ